MVEGRNFLLLAEFMQTVLYPIWGKEKPGEIRNKCGGFFS